MLRINYITYYFLILFQFVLPFLNLFILDSERSQGILWFLY